MNDWLKPLLPGLTKELGVLLADAIPPEKIQTLDEVDISASLTVTHQGRTVKLTLLLSGNSK